MRPTYRVPRSCDPAGTRSQSPDSWHTQPSFGATMMPLCFDCTPTTFRRGRSRDAHVPGTRGECDSLLPLARRADSSRVLNVRTPGSLSAGSKVNGRSRHKSLDSGRRTCPSNSRFCGSLAHLAGWLDFRVGSPMGRAAEDGRATELIHDSESLMNTLHLHTLLATAVCVDSLARSPRSWRRLQNRGTPKRRARLRTTRPVSSERAGEREFRRRSLRSKVNDQSRSPLPAIAGAGL